MRDTGEVTAMQLYTDGGSRGNPGEAAIGYILYNEQGEVLCRFGSPIGIRTNNYAEYTAMIEGLRRALTFGKSIHLSMDSELIVKQIKKEYKVKNMDLKPLYDEAVLLISKFEYFEIRHVRRENNREADKLVNLALDGNCQIDEEPMSLKKEKEKSFAASSPETCPKMEALRKKIREDHRVMIAFSGGVDSSLLAKVCKEELGENCRAVTIRAANIPASELEQAERFAKRYGINHRFVDVDIYAVEGLSGNEEDRCYTCKKFLLAKVWEEAKKNGIDIVYDGSTKDDLSDYRPGMKALRELNVQSPLMQAEFTKKEVRSESKKLGLETHDHEAMACLITRIPYHHPITEQKLRMAEEAERVLRQFGYRGVRVRVYEKLAKIEIAPAQIESFIQSKDYLAICERLKAIGFSQIALDLEGYRSGSMNG